MKKENLLEEEKLRIEEVKVITDKLEQGIKELFETEKFKNYLNVMSRFHTYSFNNALLISLQRPDATYVAGYNAWKKLFNRQVQKGEKGIRIFAPAPYKMKKDVEKLDPNTKLPIIGKDGVPMRERVEVIVPAYKIVTVFDVSQTIGEPIPEIASILTDDVYDYQRFFDAIKKVSPVPIEMEHMIGSASGYYSRAEQRIAIKEGMSPSHTLKTAIHEISHAILHNKENEIEKNNQMDRQTKEVQAESVAYTVCSHYGLDTSNYSFGYIAGWSANKNLDELKESMDIIRQTASEIIKRMDEKLLEAQEEEELEKFIVEMESFLNRLPVDFDSYEYEDRARDEEKQIQNIKADMKNGNVRYLQDRFRSILEKVGTTDMYTQAKGIVERLRKYSTEKTIEPEKKVASFIIAAEGKDITKNYHRSR